jgi:ubiquinone/menaquinone biosynthesis C-methylase UbiE
MTSACALNPVFNPRSRSFPSSYKPAERETRIQALMQAISDKTEAVSVADVDFSQKNVYAKYRFSIREDDPTPLRFYVLRSGQGIITDDARSFARQVIDRDGMAELMRRFEYRGSLVDPLENQLCYFYDGNDYEHIEFPKAPAMRNTFWSHWKWNTDANIAYLFRIYPPCLEALDGSLQQPSTVVEICGGDGNFASQALEKMGGRIENYYLVDRNQPSLERAQKQLTAHVETGKAVVVQGDVTEPFLPDLHDGTVDCALGIGALTTEVMESREDALKALRRLHQLLKPGGTLILSGFSHSYFSRDDLEEEGFEVTNTHCPSKRQYIYVAQKKFPPAGDLFIEAALLTPPEIIEDYC